MFSGPQSKAVTMAIISSFFTALAQVFFKLASGTDVAFPGNLWIWAGALAYLIAFLASMTAYRFGELTVVFPLISLCYVWAFIFGLVWMGEGITWGKTAGTLLVVAGSFVVAKV